MSTAGPTALPAGGPEAGTNAVHAAFELPAAGHAGKVVPLPQEA